MRKYDVVNVLKQLNRAWEAGLGDDDACILAGIEYAELEDLCNTYSQVKEAHDNYKATRKGEKWKVEQKIKARKNIEKKLREGDDKMSKFVAEKLDDEFATASKLEITSYGEDNTDKRERELDTMTKKLIEKGTNAIQ